MRKVRCNAGHFYDADKHMSCPYCGVAIDNFNIGEAKTQPLGGGMGGGMDTQGGGGMDDSAGSGGRTQPLDSGMSMARSGSAGKTVAHTQARELEKSSNKTVAMVNVGSDDKRIDPVVGWVVCTEGAMKGIDFKILSGRNMVGRAANNGICIKNDDTISRERHTEITYDPNGKQFYISSGAGRGLTYLNDVLVLETKVLNNFDIIKVGNTKLVFVNLCGENFSWT